MNCINCKGEKTIEVAVAITVIVRLGIISRCTNVLPVAVGLISRVTGYVGIKGVLNKYAKNKGRKSKSNS